MLFTVIEKYAKEKEGCKGYELLGIKKSQWHRYKKDNHLSLVHCKNLSMLCGSHITDDFQELSLLVLNKYYEEI